MHTPTRPADPYPKAATTYALVVLLVAAGVGVTSSTAQVSRTAREMGTLERPKVGLVLSGGSAKGMAHIGVLRIIEEVGLPVDVVTGTSMGAVVGGLYATGYTSDQLGAIARGSNWPQLFAGQPERHALLLEEQLTGRGALVTLPIEDGTIRLPSGLLSGQGVFELLTRLTWPVHTTRDFRELPRAFAAVAVELETGEAVRFDSGSLPLAIRASLSLPSLFEPVRIDGRRFIDGGVVRNLPAEDAQALGADILVCVDVSAEDEDAGPPSFLDVIAEAAFYRNQRSGPAQRARCDVIIEPDVQGLSPFAFEEAAVWIERGEAAAREALPALRALADSLGAVESTPPAASPERTSVSSQRRLAPDSAGTKAPRRVVAVDVRGVAGAAEELARRRLGLRLPASLTVDQIEAAIERVYALDAFRMVMYRLQPVRPPPEGAPPEKRAAERPTGTADSTDAYVLIVEPEASPADRLRVGLRYDTDNKAALYGSLSLRHLLRYGSTTQLSVRLGEETQLEAGYRSRLQSGRLLGLDISAVAGGQVRFTRLPVRLSFGDEGTSARGDGAPPADLAATLDVYRGQVLLGRTLGERLLVGALLGGEHARAEPEVGPDSVETYTETFSSVTALALADTRDRTSLPSRGVRLNARGKLGPGLLGDPVFQHLSVDVEGLLPLGRGGSLYGRTVWTQGYGRDLPRHYRTVLGGVEVLPLLPGRRFPLYGTEPQALIGRAGQLAAAGVQWAQPGHWFTRLTVHAGRVGNDWSLDTEAFTTGVGLTVGTATLIGPLRLTLTNDDLRDLPQITLSAGHTF